MGLFKKKDIPPKPYNTIDIQKEIKRGEQEDEPRGSSAARARNSCTGKKSIGTSTSAPSARTIFRLAWKEE